MGVVRVLPGGSSASFPSYSRHKRAKRGQVKGWTQDATRRLVQFLWSVIPEELTGPGFALTLTTGGRPLDSQLWAAARASFLEALRRRGVVRYQWLTEWTRNGRPHMHLCIYGDGLDPLDLALTWLLICQSHGWQASLKGQSIEEIFDPTGWLKYVAKHSARGVDHYQRDTPPPGWDTTGRLWGKGGDWPVAEPWIAPLTGEQTFEYQRLFIAWQVERMRSEGVPDERISLFVEGLTAPTFGGGPRGLSGWIPWEESAKLLLAATETADYIPQIEE